MARVLAAAIVVPSLAFAGLAGLAAGIPPQAHRADQAFNPTVPSLERYARGEFDAALETLLSGRTIQAVDRDFRREGSDWIDHAPALERRRRTEVVAAMSVELAAASFEQHFDQYLVARELMEWACTRLRAGAPTEAERRFFHASIALMQGARDEGLLAGGLHYGRIFASHESHALHGSTRFPDEARFEFALLTTRREAQWLAPHSLPPGFLISGMRVVDYRDDVAKLDETAADFRSFFDDPAIAHEARLRSGVLHVLRSKHDEATDDLSEATGADDPAVRYVAHLTLGAMADRTRALGDAERHYRAAHEAVAASASSVALASALYRTGRADEAAAVLRRFAASPPPQDPWRVYGQRDFRLYPSLRDAMRNAIAPRALAGNVPGVAAPDHSVVNGASTSGATRSRPLDVTLVLQEHERTLFTTPEKVEADLRKVAALLQPQDRLRVVFAGDDQRPLPFAADASLPNHVVPVETCRPIYDALGRALMQPEAPGRQHVVIVLSVGEGSGNVLTTDIVTDLARHSRARVYVMAKEPFSPYSYQTVTSLPACAFTELDWSAPRQEKLRYVTAHPPTWDWKDRELWLDGKRRLAAIAELTGGLEIHPPLISESIVGPVREALDDVRSRPGSGR